MRSEHCRLGLARRQELLAQYAVRRLGRRAPAAQPHIRREVWKGDKWNRMYGSKVADGAAVEVVRYMPMRKVLIRYKGEIISAMQWQVRKESHA